MIASLEKSERFQQEFNEYQRRCNQLSNQNAKTEVLNLLRLLHNEVRAVDGQHFSLLESKKMPSFVSDSRHKILELRRAIVKKLDEYEGKD